MRLLCYDVNVAILFTNMYINKMIFWRFHAEIAPVMTYTGLSPFMIMPNVFVYYTGL